MFEGSVSQLIAVNTSQVDPATFTSYWDALDPKYRGQIVVSDIRRRARAAASRASSG